jgi:hypothetical protein
VQVAAEGIGWPINAIGCTDAPLLIQSKTSGPQVSAPSFKSMTRTSTRTRASASTTDASTTSASTTSASATSASASTDTSANTSGPRRTGPLGGPCETVKPADVQPDSAQSDEPKLPPSLSELLHQMWSPESTASDFGVKLTDAETKAISWLRSYAERKQASGWKTYKASQADKYADDDGPAFKSSGNPLPSILTAGRKPSATMEPKRRAAKTAQAAACLAIGSLLIRDGRVSVGHVALLLQSVGAPYTGQPELAAAIRSAMPGHGIRWADQGDLELNPASKLEPNALSSVWAQRADLEIQRAKADEETAPTP